MTKSVSTAATESREALNLLDERQLGARTAGEGKGSEADEHLQLAPTDLLSVADFAARARPFPRAQDCLVAGCAREQLARRGLCRFHDKRYLRTDPDRRPDGGLAGWVAAAQPRLGGHQFCLAGLGEQLPPAPDAVALDAFLARRRAADPVRFPDLSLAIIKLLGKGEYVLERPDQRGEGHFGLAVRDYTHATAPNRRYPDLVVQRLLKAAIVGDRTPYPDDELAALAQHCTEQEDNAAKVERHVRKSAAALLLEHRIGERFDAIVTGAAEKGTRVRIDSPTVEGRVVRGFEGLDVGDMIKVELVHTDAARGYIDFARAGQPR